ASCAGPAGSAPTMASRPWRRSSPADPESTHLPAEGPPLSAGKSSEAAPTSSGRRFGFIPLRYHRRTMDRPVISFLTDFGPESAPAICRGVMLSIAPDVQIVDISHSVRKYGIEDGAYLLWSAVPWMPVGTVHVAVV